MRKQLFRAAAALAGLVAAASCAHGNRQDTARAPQQPSAQQQQQPAAQQPAAQSQIQHPTTPATPGAAPTAARPLADRCVDLLGGRVQAGEDVVALRASCEALVRRGDVEGVQAGLASSPPPQGPSAQAAFTQAGSELVGRDSGKVGLGRTTRGPVKNTLLTNPLGWFSGLGVNTEYIRPFPWDHASWVAAARFSRTKASDGAVSTFGIGGGADLFIYGRGNEGVRIGPRIDLAFGRETIDGSSDFARLGASAEIGYNFIASNGLTALVAGGFGGRLAGDSQDEDFASYTGGEDGPYLKLGIGYSW
jgi:hypothetical protein